MSDLHEPGPASPARWRPALVAGLVLVLAIAAVPVITALTDDDSAQSVHGDRDDAKHAVLVALSATVSSGSYDMRYDLHVEPGSSSDPRPCVNVPSPGPGTIAPACERFSTPALDTSGTGTVNIEPYALTAVTTVGTFRGITLFVNDTTVWEQGGANYGSQAGVAAPGSSLSGFADLVEGSLGPGPGAYTMLGLSTRSGYLALEADAVTHAAPDGTGEVDSEAVTYYDVAIDVARLADTPNLSGDQRVAVDRASSVFREAGYKTTNDRVGVNAAGFIREVTSTSTFDDGTQFRRHTLFSNFGCARKITMPNEPPVDATAGTCPPVAATTVPSSAPSTTVPPTASAPSSTSTTTTTMIPATTEPVTTKPPTTAAGEPTSTPNG